MRLPSTTEYAVCVQFMKLDSKPIKIYGLYKTFESAVEALIMVHNINPKDRWFIEEHLVECAEATW